MCCGYIFWCEMCVGGGGEEEGGGRKLWRYYHQRVFYFRSSLWAERDISAYFQPIFLSFVHHGARICKGEVR